MYHLVEPKRLILYISLTVPCWLPTRFPDLGSLL